MTTRRRSDADKGESPFRRYHEMTRYKAALDMIEKRRVEIHDLERALTQTDDRGEQRRLTTRLLATKNNLKSWQAYLPSHPVVQGAVIAP